MGYFFKTKKDIVIAQKANDELIRRKKLRAERDILVENKIRERCSSNNPLIILMDELPELKQKIIIFYEQNCEK